MKKLFFILSIVFVIIYLPVFLISTFPPFYHWQYRGIDVYEGFLREGVGSFSIHENTNDLILYMHGLRPELNPNFFTASDIRHMKDVRTLFCIFDFVLFIATFFLLASGYKAFKKRFRQKDPASFQFFDISSGSDILQKSGVASIVIITSIAILSLLNFDFVFTAFHKILFRNDGWLLDSNSSNLIRMVPVEFFQTFGVISGIMSMFVSCLLIIYGYGIKRTERNSRGSWSRC